MTDDDRLSPQIDNPIELDRYALCTVIYAERQDGQILLLERAQGTAMAGMFFMPGGIVDPGETPWAAVQRELSEETGMTLDGPVQMVGCYRLFVYGQNFLQLSFKGKVTGDVKLSGEHLGYRWVDPQTMTDTFSAENRAELAGGDPRIEALLGSIAEDLDRYLGQSS